MVGGELKEVEQGSVFHEALDRAKHYLDEFEAFSISCTRMKESLDRTLARSAATDDTSKATRRLSRKLVEEEGGP
jgi:type II secretory pathway component PulF